jgi:putative ABC transport system substrate-binding protein
MNRREVLTLLGAAGAAWPVEAWAQPNASKKLIGMLIGGSSADPELQARVTALETELASFGWCENRLRFIPLYAEGNPDKLPGLANYLVKMPADILIASGSPATAAAKQATTQIPIVMVAVGDAVGAGFIESLARRTFRPGKVRCVRSHHRERTH